MPLWWVAARMMALQIFLVSGNNWALFCYLRNFYPFNQGRPLYPKGLQVDVLMEVFGAYAGMLLAGSHYQYHGLDRRLAM